MKPNYIVYYCGFLIGISAFSIDIMLPSLHDMSLGLGTSIDLAQMNITFYIFAFGAGQIVFGPLSDRFGRRPTILLGLSIYIAGASFALVAPTIETILAGRILQGFGGASCQSVGRAIIRDRYSGLELARNMSVAMAIFSFGPIFAPFFGYGLTRFGGWQSVFIGMLVFAFLMLLATLWVPETLKERNKNSLKPDHILKSIFEILSNPQSRYFIIVSAIIMVSMLSFVTNAPRLYANLGVTGLWFAAAFALIGTGIVAGQFVNQKLLSKLGQVGAIRLSATVMLITMIVLTFGAAFDILNIASFTLLMFIFGAFFLVCFSNSISLVIDPHGKIAGFTSSLYGFIVQVFSSVVVSILTLVFQGMPLYWALNMVFVSALALILVRHWQIFQGEKLLR